MIKVNVPALRKDPVLATSANNPMDPKSSAKPGSEHPPAITASDRLITIFRRPGPYTSVYLATLPRTNDSESDIELRWAKLRQTLQAQGAPPDALAAIEARLALPAPEDISATALIAAADGTTTVDHGLEPPAYDLGLLSNLPYAAPLLEWDQSRVAHLVVTVDDEGADIVAFGLDHFFSLESVTTGGEVLADDIAGRAQAIAAELVVLAGDAAHTTALSDHLALKVGANCRIVSEPIRQDPEELADAAVRHVTDTSARETMGYLREHRFLSTHNAAVEGTPATIAALAEGTADLVLIHDDPEDQRLCWIGPEPRQISLVPQPGCPEQARLVDAVIRSAIMQGVSVHIIPNTGPRGPEDNTAAFTNGTNLAKNHRE